MARTITRYKGTVNNTTSVIYTCPASKVAKVKFDVGYTGDTWATHPNGQTSSGDETAGNYIRVEIDDNHVYVLSTIGTDEDKYVAPGTDADTMIAVSNTATQQMPDNFILTEGDIIRVSSNTTKKTILYSFLVIEEDA